jgi:hypothetical protein
MSSVEVEEVEVSIDGTNKSNAKISTNDLGPCMAFLLTFKHNGEKFDFSMKFQFLSSSLLFRIIQTENASHAESTGDAQEKSARSYELKFAPN